MTRPVGFYEKKQLLSPSRIVRWSHGRRFEMAVRLAQRIGGRSLLDYGCGDGTFLGKVQHVVEHCVGSDLSPHDLSPLPGVRIVANADLDASHDGAYDLVFCMEVLEHCPTRDVEKVLSDLRRLVAPRGAVIISVPIEIGPTLIGKHAMRLILGMRNVGDYKWTERYPVGELLKMVFAGESTTIERPLQNPQDPSSCHTHYGFNWRALSRRIVERFVVEERSFTPLGWTRGLASSQVWFVCRPR